MRGEKKVTSVLSTTGLKQNLQKLAIKVYLCSVGPIQGSPGGRHEGAQESVPVLFVKVWGGQGETPGRAKPQEPACKGWRE